MHHFKGFDMINLQYEMKIWKKLLIKPQMTKNSISPPLVSTLRLFIILFDPKCVLTARTYLQLPLRQWGAGNVYLADR